MKSFRFFSSLLFLSTLFGSQLLADVTGVFKFSDSGHNKLDNYKTGPIYVEVVDKDKDVSGSVADTLSVFVKSTSEGVWEKVVLTETTVNSGVFFGNIKVDSVGVAAADGKLQVKVGDDIYGEYRDVKNDFGNPQVISGRSLYGFTEIPGATYSVNTTWKKGYSPYLISGDVRVTNGATLTVEAGVEARFLANTDKTNSGDNIAVSELRMEGGNLISVGTSADSVRFTLQSSNPQRGQWYGIMVYNGGRLTMEYTKIQYTNTAIYLVSSPGQSSIKNSLFQNNYTGINVSGYVLTTVTIDKNRIENFNTGITLSGVDTLTVVSNNEIKNTSTNGNGINEYNATAKVVNNTITFVGTGISLYRGSSGIQSPVITKNTIKNSNTGISIDGNMQPIINYNNLADNFQYGVQNNTQYDIDARYNWWGTGVTAQMNTGGNPKNIGYIYDKFDNSSYGMVNYAGWLDAENGKPTPNGYTGTFKLTDSSHNRVDNYKNGPVYVEVVDKDKDVSGSVADTLSVFVKSTSEGVWEKVVLTETTVNSGVFFGNIKVDSVGVAAADGKLQVKVGDDIYGEYRDVKNDFGNPQVISGRSLYGFTEIPGATYSVNTTWKKGYSPYLISGDVRVTNGATLTVEAGVEARFLANTDKTNSGDNIAVSELRMEGGNLISVGTSADSVRFTLQSSNPQRGQWYGIMVYNGGRLTMEYTKIQYTNTAIYLVSSPGQSSIKNSLFQNNYTGINVSGYVLTTVTIDKNRIENFNTGITLSGVDTLTVVSNNEIKNTSTNGNGINEYNATAKVVNNTITFVGTGISLYRGSSGIQSPVITKNTIKNSNTGISIDGNMQPIINYNNLADNFQYGVQNNTQYDIDARYNWWGTGVTAQMNTGGNPKNIGYIYDKFDNSSYGMVNYAGWLQSEFSSILPTPVLLLPANNAQINTTPIAMKWRKVKDATNYTLQISLSNDFLIKVVDDSTITDTTKQISGLQYFKQYYWRIKAKNEKAKSSWSEVWSFKTGDVAETSWSLNITITSNNNTDPKILAIGQHPNATDDIDTSLGEYLLPPSPPAGIADARLALPNGSETNKDFRNTTQKTITWQLSYQPGSSGFPMKLEWDPNNLPKGSFILQDAVTGTIVNVNMKLAGSATITNAAIKQLVIVFRYEISANASYTAGWNLISAPVKMADMKAKTIFPTSQSYLFSYNNGYVIDTTLVNGKGYWIKLDAAKSVTYVGENMTGNVTLKNGWNLIGVADKKVAVNNLVTNPANVITSSFFGYNNGYQIADTLYPGYGYWIKAKEDGGIIPSQAFNKTITREVINPKWNTLSFVDSKGETRNLYLAKESINKEYYEMPPMAPTGITDIRFADGTFAADARSVKSIQLQSSSYPIRIISNESILIRYSTGKGIKEVRVAKGGEITLTDPSIRNIEVCLAEIPAEFALMQNYPNPFNPETKIEYWIPETGRVTLKIYDVLGREVETLVDLVQEAGKYEVRWNATKYSSGVYFYNITTGNNRSVKKMLMIK